MTSAAAMQDFVQLWVYLSATPLFGLTATLGAAGVAALVGLLAASRSMYCAIG